MSIKGTFLKRLIRLSSVSLKSRKHSVEVGFLDISTSVYTGRMGGALGHALPLPVARKNLRVLHERLNVMYIYSS